jgi:hydroxymethylpyrimidine pyrophosphatase-like HAD family hydrolase
MLTTTAKGLIMGNAPKGLKAKLPHLEVILNNDEDGVAKYISEKVLDTLLI